jgi:hypothetical protein
MQWRKLGIVYSPDGSQPWAQSHAMIPTPVLLENGILRIYCTMCDDQMIGRPGYVDVNPQNPLEIFAVSKEPLLDVGLPGTFDENGVLPCSVVAVGSRYFMYYVGFELGTKIRYRLLTGIAVSEDAGQTFKRLKNTPILERSDAELYFRGGPFALWQQNRMRLWYVAGSHWTDLGGKSMPLYDLKYQESVNGIIWQDEGILSLAATSADEHGFGRPWVVRRGENAYQLFYSIRKRSVRAYRMGYAESKDGLHWTRKDNELGLDVSPGSFDSDAIMYAAVITVGAKTYCFYNGNDFGRFGFAVAELS